MPYTGKTNWQNDEAVMPNDMNRLGTGVNELTTMVNNHTSDFNNPHQTTKETIGLENVENIIPYEINMTTADKAKAQLKGEKTLGNVTDADFLAKANEANLPGSDIVPDNLTRLNIYVSSYNNLGFNGRTFKITVNDVVYDNPNIYITDSTGHLYVELPRGNYTVEMTNVPGQYNKPAILTFTTNGGDIKNLNILLEKRLDLAVNFILNIDQSNSNSTTCCSYGGNLAGASPSTFNNTTFVDNGWENRWPYIVDKPCIIKNNNGTPSLMCYLNPNDFTKDESGTDVSAYLNGSSDTSTITYDVMMERNNIYYDLSVANDVLKITLNTNPTGVNNFHFPFRYRGKYYEKRYVGCFQGIVRNGKLRSITGSGPVRTTLANLRTYAQANGSGYENILYTHYVWEQFLYVMRFARLDSRAFFGIPANTSTSTIQGKMLQAGLNVKNTNANPVSPKWVNVRVNGIEQLYAPTHVEGIEKKRVGNVGIIGGKQWIRIQDYPSSVSDVEQDNFFWSYGLNGYMRRSVCTANNIDTGTTTSGDQRNTYRAPFFPSGDSGGSATTYYRDGRWLYETNDVQYGIIGLGTTNTSDTGIFSIRIYYGNNTSNAYGRLTYCKSL